MAYRSSFVAMTDQPRNYIAVLNCGSSSLKFSLYGCTDLSPLFSGHISGIGNNNGQFKVIDNRKQEVFNQKGFYSDAATATQVAIEWLKKQPFCITAIGHRLVQGGPEHRNPELITDALMQCLKDYIYLAPNHLADELNTIGSFRSAFPGIKQVACFDTAFHKDLPYHVKYYPLPAVYQNNGLLKYGFHGLSFAYILQKLEEDSKNAYQKIIIAHLGSGASMAAVQNGICIDTTMGLSPIGGLVMSTRCGDMDPGVILFLLKQYKLDVNKLDELLSKQSGLLAIAGTGDMEELLAQEQTNSAAKLAIHVFCYHAKKQIGALAVALGGLDLLVFTGGIGANSPVIREYICRDMNFFGIELNNRANFNDQETISLNTSRVSVMALPTHEELMIAQAVDQLLKRSIKN